MKTHIYTNQRALRRAFWAAAAAGEFGELSITRRRITNYSGKGKMHNTDTRVAFCDWLDALTRDGQVSQELAQRATLS